MKQFPRFIQLEQFKFIASIRLRVDSEYWIETNVSVERSYQSCIQSTEMAELSTENSSIEYKKFG